MEQQLKFGTLVVIVDKARNLPNRKRIGKQDAYAIVRLGHEVQKTPTDKRAGQVPSWNHEIRFVVPNENENILKISIFNEDSKTPELIGDCAINLSDLYRTHEFDSWIDLKYKEKPAGELYVELTFYYEGPPKPNPKVQFQQPAQIHPPSALQCARTPDSFSDVNSFSTCEYSLHHNTSSQDVLLYAQTWNGVRDNRIIRPAPGDVRRKSMSTDTYTDDLRERQPNGSFHSYARTSIGSLARPYVCENIDINDQDCLENYANSAHFREITEAEYLVALSPDHHYPARGCRRSLDEDIVEPLLDPRYGTQHQLRNSVRIVSPHPEYPSGYRHSPLLEQEQFDVDSHGPSKPQTYVDNAYHLPHGSVHYERSGQPINRTAADSPKYHQHVHAQSYSYNVREPLRPLPQPSHLKSASTSVMPSKNFYRGGSGEARENHRHDRNSSDDSRNQPYYANDLTYQYSETFAVTPAEHMSQRRQLPTAPARPAKIPLGLTQEEYDILNGD